MTNPTISHPWNLIVLIYVLSINLVTLIAFASDKGRAWAGKWRIPNKILLGLTLLGGSLGALIAMHLIRHKTRTWYYALGVPIILIIQLTLVGLFWQC